MCLNSISKQYGILIKDKIRQEQIISERENHYKFY